MAYFGIAFAAFSMILTYLYLPESPRFLYGMKRYKEANQILQRMQRINQGRRTQSNFFKEEEQILNSSLEANAQLKEKQKRGSLAHMEDEKVETSIKDLWVDDVLRINLMVMMALWSFGSFAFFLIPYMLQNLVNSMPGTNIYTMSLATEIAEMLASVICIFITRIMDLKIAMFGALGLITVASVLIILFQSFIYKAFDGNINAVNYTEAGLVMLTNLGIVCQFDFAYLINPTLFPTIYLATAYGACNILGRFISIFAPIVARLPDPVPLIVLTILAFLCILLTAKLRKVKEG